MLLKAKTEIKKSRQVFEGQNLTLSGHDNIFSGKYNTKAKTFND